MDSLYKITAISHYEKELSVYILLYSQSHSDRITVEVHLVQLHVNVNLICRFE